MEAAVSSTARFKASARNASFSRRCDGSMLAS
jgi:hypothetical protein